MIEALKKYPNYKSGENKIEEDKTSDSDGAPSIKMPIKNETGFNDNGEAVSGGEISKTDSAEPISETELNLETDKNVCTSRNNECGNAENEAVQAESVAAAGGDSACENEEPGHEKEPEHESGPREEESALPLICKYDARLIKRVKKNVSAKRKVKRVHGIAMLTPLAMEELLEKQNGAKISGKINYKQRKPKDVLSAGEIKMPGGRWDVVDTECEVPGEIKGYIPIDETRYIAVCDTANLFDKLFPIVFVGTLIWLLVSGYLQGREAVYMIAH